MMYPPSYMLLCDKNYFLSQALSHSFFSLQQAFVLSQAAESALQQACTESHACASSTTSTSVASTSVLAAFLLPQEVTAKENATATAAQNNFVFISNFALNINNK
ncbi:hypothetical protein HMPREF2531_00306 [Bacteroides intestinalis]|uniref:Uncharacterized protein n=1 Tax=Bacteroides intestinalis TaxID=329854 RepID=A0A139LUD8_9BACE|nr:hypothetical protein HMPREF2531_00306 [Bacteroides intestinalis]